MQYGCDVILLNLWADQHFQCFVAEQDYACLGHPARTQMHQPGWLLSGLPCAWHPLVLDEPSHPLLSLVPTTLQRAPPQLVIQAAYKHH